MVVGGVITVVIGGTAFTVSQTDVINNFAEDTGMSQQQAEEYVNKVNQDDLVSYDKIGADMITDGQEILETASSLDCANYDYEWQSATLSCDEGKAQLTTVGSSEIALGEAYKVLNSDSATKTDIDTTIARIDTLNTNYRLPVVSSMMDQATIDDIMKTNSYNKSLLKAALEGE